MKYTSIFFIAFIFVACHPITAEHWGLEKYFSADKGGDFKIYVHKGVLNNNYINTPISNEYGEYDSGGDKEEYIFIQRIPSDNKISFLKISSIKNFVLNSKDLKNKELKLCRGRNFGGVFAVSEDGVILIFQLNGRFVFRSCFD